MIHRSHLVAAALSLTLAFSTSAPARAGVQILPDSTVHDVWQLSNGLTVVVHHISTSHHVSITLAWPTGSDADPAGLAGRAALMAELELTAAAGEVPERTRDELSALRPSGWTASAGSRVTQVTEVATLPLFPGVLHQTALRLRGVTVGDSVFRRALESVRTDAAARRKPTSAADLYVGLREVALGRFDPNALDAGLKALAKAGLAGIQGEMSRTFVPAGAVLSLAGNLGDMNLHALIENEFGGIPGGTRPAPLAPAKYRPGLRQAPRAGLDRNVGGIGVIAPALDDSTHPSFYFATLIFATYIPTAWGPLKDPIHSRFQYSLFDDPDLVRFYPPIGNEAVSDTTMDEVFDDALDRLGTMIISPETETPVMRGVLWLLGAPMPPEILARATRDPTVLATVSSTQAVRELWGGEPFWAEYRYRLLNYSRTYNSWIKYLQDPKNRVKLVLTPKR